jgi:NAD(P)H-dependent nitrite reductase small subunit
MSNFLRAGLLSEIPTDQGKCVVIGERRIALFRDGDDVFAIDNVCPHEGAPLADGFYADRVVVCPLHGWEFNVTNGRVSGGTESVQAFEARVTADGTVEVNLA